MDSTARNMDNMMDDAKDSIDSAKTNLTFKMGDVTGQAKHLASDLGLTDNPQIRQLQDMGRRVVSNIQSNPTPWIYGAMAFVGGIFFYSMMSRRSSSSRYVA